MTLCIHCLLLYIRGKEITAMTKYSELTQQDKERIDLEFYNLTRISSTGDGGHLAAWIADNIWKIDGHKCRKIDSDRWAAVLTYLVFSGKLVARIG
jgi:hypothetical protein